MHPPDPLPDVDAVEAARGATWALAAVASLLATTGQGADIDLDFALTADPARREVLLAAGLLDAQGRPGRDLRTYFDDPGRNRLARMLVSTLGQASRAAGGTTPTWADQSDEVVIAQGEASAAGGHAVANRVVPRYPDIAAGLAAGGTILDVGTGIGALATALAENLPAARVLGIDIAERVLAIARARTTALPSDLADRLEFELRDVTDTQERGVYDVVWLPLPFLPEPVLAAALPRVLAALRPGGLLVAATTPALPDPVAAAAARWAATLAGGTGEDPDQMRGRLTVAGLGEITATPSFPGGPILVAGRLPA